MVRQPGLVHAGDLRVRHSRCVDPTCPTSWLTWLIVQPATWCGAVGPDGVRALGPLQGIPVVQMGLRLIATFQLDTPSSYRKQSLWLIKTGQKRMLPMDKKN